MEVIGKRKKTFLRPDEASERFGIPVSTLYTWYELGKIEGLTVGPKCVRIHLDSLLDFLKSRSRLADW